MTDTVLVVDDEADLADAVVDALRRFGFEASAVGTLAEARQNVDRYDLVLLDLGLPDGDGLQACGEFAGRTPVVVISARVDEVDRILALELGADDYIAKPFSTRELVARCRAVLRRCNGGARVILRAADLTIDLDAMTVTRDGVVIPLATKEFDLLVALARRSGKVVRRSELAASVWNTDIGFVARSMEVHISSVRHKLGAAPGGHYIDTVQGIGYRFVP